MDYDIECYISHRGDDNPFLIVQKYVLSEFKHIKNTVVVLGYNTHFNKAEIKKLYPNRKIVIYQLEQLFNGLSQWYNPTSQNPIVIQRTNHIKLALNQCDEIWEYSLENLDYINKHISKKPIKHVPLIPCSAVKSEKYDILFYGSTNNRRIKYLKILDERYKLLVVSPKNNGYKNWKPPVFGEDIYNYVRNSKAVINIHYCDGLIQEQVRIFELLSNGIKVISEKSNINYYKDSVIEFENEYDMCIKVDEMLGKKIKIGAIYNSFYGLEQIESSINSIKNAVDEIVIVHQRIGFNGQLEPLENEEILTKLTKQGVKIFYYTAPDDCSPHRGILEKRNLGLKMCKEYGCDYIIPLDCDEEYDSDILLQEVYRMEAENIETLYSPIYTYYGDRNHYFTDTYYVPSVYKVNDRNFRAVKTSVLCDPFRKMDEGKFSISEMPMHHYSYQKSCYHNKIGATILSVVNSKLGENVQKISEHLQNWKSGDKALVHQNEKNTGNLYLSLIQLKNKKEQNNLLSVKKSMNNYLSVGLIYSGRVPLLLSDWMNKLIEDTKDFTIKPQLIVVNNSGKELNLSIYESNFSEIIILEGYKNASWENNTERLLSTSLLLIKCYNDILEHCKGDLVHFREDDIIPDHNAFDLLYQQILQGKPIISGLYANRTLYTAFFRKEDKCNKLQEVEPIEVEFCPTGFVLFQREKAPTFEKNDKIRPHDWAWTERWRKELGQKVFTHPNATCRHYINEETYVFPTLKITPENNYMKVKAKMTSNKRYVW